MPRQLTTGPCRQCTASVGWSTASAAGARPPRVEPCIGSQRPPWRRTPPPSARRPTPRPDATSRKPKLRLHDQGTEPKASAMPQWPTLHLHHPPCHTSKNPDPAARAPPWQQTPSLSVHNHASAADAPPQRQPHSPSDLPPNPRAGATLPWPTLRLHSQRYASAANDRPLRPASRLQEASAPPLTRVPGLRA